MGHCILLQTFRRDSKAGVPLTGKECSEFRIGLSRFEEYVLIPCIDWVWHNYPWQSDLPSH